MESSKEINYRTALRKPDCADNWLTEIEIEFEKVSEELEMDITLIFPVTERSSRPRRIPQHHQTLAASPPLPRPASKPPAAAPPGFSIVDVFAVVSTVEQHNPKIKDRSNERGWTEGVVEIKGPV
ncbi:uncharacterized protein H6S33_000660 [Morchella sextelata]|uniref:uncharacterized protein n=1 Tax=Morchella sextelata TaxID=1174677 RepID=UPI001D04C968|nr:uncharacterized protein H6S33_000660 [Morchella sextelata]KAH0615024.1 hypothetical protein H6S33_000660 [Morchella sextelata]